MEYGSVLMIRYRCEESDGAARKPCPLVERANASAFRVRGRSSDPRPATAVIPAHAPDQPAARPWREDHSRGAAVRPAGQRPTRSAATSASPQIRTTSSCPRSDRCGAAMYSFAFVAGVALRRLPALDRHRGQPCPAVQRHRHLGAIAVVARRSGRPHPARARRRWRRSSPRFR